ncbi:MAG: hypothetical protein M1820_002060 [Bogoriella megaspora]|nr:MAG: hypothetical protein M1820_002060 [Bogoriella megaspora]
MSTEPPISASTLVFALPELFETILLLVPPLDVLLLQRVSRTWQLQIQSSPSLQRALFLQPDWSQCVPLNTTTSSTSTTPNFTKPFIPHPNPLLPRAWPCNYPTIHTTTTTLPIAPPPPSSPFHNYYITNTPPAKPAPQVYHGLEIDYPSPLTVSPLSTIRPAVAHPDASWRKMLLCQPPCTRLRLVRASPWKLSREVVVCEEGGIRMGGLVERAEGQRRVDGEGSGEGDGDGEGERERERGRVGEWERGKEGREKRRWDTGFVSGDGCWHFEGLVERRRRTAGV